MTDRMMVLKQLRELERMDIDGLRERWVALMASPPPKIRAVYLRHRLAYRVQELAYPPLGYDVKDRKLVINQSEAQTIRDMYERFLVLKSITHLAAELRDQGMRTKAMVTQNGNIRDGVPISKGYLYRILTNPVYIGQVRYKGQTYKGEHAAIIDQNLWDQVQASFGTSPRTRANGARCQTPALLKGLACCGGCSSALTPTSTRKNGKLYSYYAGHKYLYQMMIVSPQILH